MPITTVEDNGRFYVRGVTGETDTAYAGTKVIPVGGHLVGFDDSFADPLVMRAFYDPSRISLPSGFVTIGYLQYMRITFGGQAIPPSVFSPRLASRQLYATANQTFIDFMDPREAKEKEIEVPYYARNGALLNDRLSVESDFYDHPLPNGSLYSIDPAYRVSRYASIVAEVSGDLVVESDVFTLIDGLAPLAEIPITSGDQREAYQIAIAYLTDNNVDSDDSEDAPLLDSITNSDMSAKVVGKYVLLTLPDEEGFGPTLVIQTSQSGPRRVIVHLVGQHEMATLNAGFATDAFWRIYEWLKDNDRLTTAQRKAVANTHRGRGRGGLDADPFDLKPTDVAVEVNYATVLAASKPRLLREAPRFLNGFTWSVLLRYNDDTQIMQATAIRGPKELTSFDAKPPTSAYFDARTSPLLKDYRIDTSNFTRAAMLRENFAAGTKLTYI
ncbi:hypothetical protein GCM10009677_09380 [Sphaerisporangium rubeum]|uniref:Uncharacterized protein n=1 Tax=Sphaerisporangium rubeum TaxID=321317 RepID=A0A7X0M9D9_9ACTN|nr:hypothetical protein [Sphaerisporangium rubeum]MBB6476555.1 hypothetical protein [Sphaerisporangium rubeum]